MLCIEPFENQFVIVKDNAFFLTPKGNKLVLPTQKLADNILNVMEQGKKTDHLIKLCFTALDITPSSRQDFIEDLLSWISGDATLYYDTQNHNLFEKQKKYFSKIHAIIEKNFGKKIQTSNSFSPPKQNLSLFENITNFLNKLDNFALTGILDLAQISKSLLATIAFYEQEICDDILFQATHTEELFQQETWGTDEEVQNKLEQTKNQIKTIASFFKSLDFSQ